MSTYLAFNGKRLVQKTFSDGVYRAELYIVDDTPLNSTELQGPISSGTPVTLPESGTYIGDELIVKLNGVSLVPGFNYNFVGTGSKTQVSFVFDLNGTRSVPDVIEFYKEVE